MKAELSKLQSDREVPDEAILKKEIAQEFSGQWPQLADKADKIVDSFLSFFEEECLAREELQGLSLMSIIRQESNATRQVVREEGDKTRESFGAQYTEMSQKLDFLVRQRTLQETTPLKTTNALQLLFRWVGKGRSSQVDLKVIWCHNT